MKFFSKKVEPNCTAAYSWFWDQDKERVDFQQIVDAIESYGLKLIGLTYSKGNEFIDNKDCLTFKVLGPSRALNAFEDGAKDEKKFGIQLY